ncbi:MAG TPA: DUF2461 domain-containing protein [Aeromicrobium sp.]|nr:DUF2461 domain-containing protein [Aeromicrobium sp.]
MSGFEGFPEAALDFYDDLEVDNTKSFWQAHKSVYDEAVAAPMKALTAALADEFGEAKVFRPYRDVRFAKNKTPYKTHQGAYVPTGPSTGYYVEVGAAGVRVGAGFYEAASARLAVIREAMADPAHGAQLEAILAELESDGWQVGGETLKTAPRGYEPNHPRIELLRHKSLTVGRDYGFDAVIHSPALVDRVRDDWRKTTPFLDWVEAHGTS